MVIHCMNEFLSSFRKYGVTVQESQTREISYPCFGDDLIRTHIRILPEPGIIGMVSIVSQDEIAVFRNYINRIRRSRHSLHDIRLVKWIAASINVHVPAADPDFFPRQADNPLYILHTFIIRIIKDNDLPPLRVRKPVGQPASDNPVSRHDGGFHGAGRDPAISDQKGIQDECDQGSCGDDLDCFIENVLYRFL